MITRRTATFWFYTTEDYYEFFDMFGEVIELLHSYEIELDNLKIKAVVVGKRMEG